MTLSDGFLSRSCRLQWDCHRPQAASSQCTTGTKTVLYHFCFWQLQWVSPPFHMGRCLFFDCLCYACVFFFFAYFFYIDVLGSSTWYTTAVTTLRRLTLTEFGLWFALLDQIPRKLYYKIQILEWSQLHHTQPYNPAGCSHCGVIHVKCIMSLFIDGHHLWETEAKVDKTSIKSVSAPLQRLQSHLPLTL